MAIVSFADSTTENFFITGKNHKRIAWTALSKVVIRKLDMLEYAQTLSDLMAPPGNRLEALSGNLKGYHSVRINNQWRIVFKWTDRGPSEVQVCDYH